MNTIYKYNENDISADTFLESLCYDSKLSNQKFKIDSINNLHITEQSTINNSKEIVPLDLINPEPTKEHHLNKPLMLLALASALASSAFFASAIFMGQLWAVTFALVIWTFGMATLFASYKNRTAVYQYKFADTNTVLFTLAEPVSHNDDVVLFVNSLNQRIVNLVKENNRKQEELRISNNKELSYNEISLENENDNEIYLKEKKSQYITHIDFLFNHGIIDEMLYEKLSLKVDAKIFESENRFIEKDSVTFNERNLPNNIINFPVNA